MPKILYNFLANEPPNEASIVPFYCLSHGPASAEVDLSYHVTLFLAVDWHWAQKLMAHCFKAHRHNEESQT